MESAWLRGPAAVAADDVETGRLGRFSELQPPPYAGDANASPADAQARTRGQLLWELNKARIHQGMILRKLAETEHAIAMCFTAAGHSAVPTLPWSQDYWQFRTPLVPSPLEEEAPLHSPCSNTEHPTCGSRGPAAVRVPPLYPHVEWPPPPLLQPESTSDTEKQQGCGSSGARTHPFDGYVELCRSPNKHTMAEASVPATANAGAQPIAVTPGRKDAAVGECKDEVEDGHVVPPFYESGNQSSGQGKAEETTPVDQINVPILQPGRYRPESQERAALDQQKVREFSVPQLGNGAEQWQECSSPGVSAHMFNGYVELCLSPSKQTPVEETLVPMAAKAAISPIQSALSFGNVEDDHDVQPLGEFRNQSNGQRKAVESAMEDQTDKTTGPPAGQHRSENLENAAYNEQKKVESSEFDLDHEQRKAVEPALKDQTDEPTRMPGQHRSASLENAAYNEHKKFDLDHEQSKALESAMEDRTDKPTEPSGQHRSASLENAAYNEQKKVEFGESADERTSAGVKRKLNAATSSVKKKKPLGECSCTICYVNTPSHRQLEEHMAGKLHRRNLTALQSPRNGTAEPNTKATPVLKRITETNTESPCRDGEENTVEGSGSQQGGKPHPKSSPNGKGCGTGKKAGCRSALYCKLCNLQCDHENTLASHLAGKKHRRRKDRENMMEASG